MDVFAVLLGPGVTNLFLLSAMDSSSPSSWTRAIPASRYTRLILGT